jgi:hypothetical protein
MAKLSATNLLPSEYFFLLPSIFLPYLL